MDKEIRVPKEEFMQLPFSLLHCFFFISLTEQIFAYTGFRISFHLHLNLLVCNLWPPVSKYSIHEIFMYILHSNKIDCLVFIAIYFV